MIQQNWSFEQPLPLDWRSIVERAGRTCYKSEPHGSSHLFVDKLKRLGHLSVFEHVSASVRLVTSRGVTHELVRHRLASYSQESTRYCDYGDKNVVFIEPAQWDSWTATQKRLWHDAMSDAESAYHDLRAAGLPPQEARGVLPIDLKTEIVVTANLREWMHIFDLRCASAAHPQIRELMCSVKEGMGI